MFGSLNIMINFMKKDLTLLLPRIGVNLFAIMTTTARIISSSQTVIGHRPTSLEARSGAGGDEVTRRSATRKQKI